MGLPQPPGQPEKVATVSLDACHGKPVNVITGQELKEHGGITALPTRVRHISAERGRELTLDDDVSEKSIIKSEPITQQEEYLEDAIGRTASPSAEDAELEDGGTEHPSVSPAVEGEANPGRFCQCYEGMPRI